MQKFKNYVKLGGMQRAKDTEQSSEEFLFNVWAEDTDKVIYKR